MNTVEIQSDVLRPFGPMILNVMLPKQHINKLIEMTDDNSHRDNMDGHLAGIIKSEPRLDFAELEENNFLSIFEEIGKEFVRTELSRNNHFVFNSELPEHKITTYVTNAWCVSQYENEYNPIHYHTKCDISAVLYLKMPKTKPRNLPGKRDIDGCIEFVNNSIDSGMLQAGQFLIKPQVGQLLMFPSNLLHTVYPFIGDGERRSIAFNLGYFLGSNGENSFPKKPKKIVDLAS
jgi:uncharacterized protein (TIGR02466 family)